MIDNPEHALLIKEAKLKVLTAYETFFNTLKAKLSPEDFVYWKHFIFSNTYCAGGFFRSIFSKTPVNDIDIFSYP